MKHRYLFILEVAPIKVGKTYDELPSHLTLMSRFFSDLSPAQMSEAVGPIFNQTAPMDLTFRETTELGLKKLMVHMVEHSSSLEHLHNKLRSLLDSINAEHEYLQFIGKNYKPHVTERPGVHFGTGEKQAVRAAYLVEIVDEKRVIRCRFELSGKGQSLLSS